MKYRWRTKPFRHQVKAVKKLLRNGYGGALLMEPRTGKTKAVIDWLSILAKAGKVRRVIIVAPIVTLGVWEDEFAAHCPVRTEIVVWDKKGRKKYDLPTNPRALNVVLINHEAFSTPDEVTVKGKRRKQFGKKALRKALRQWRAHAMVIDESHRIKSSGSKKTYYIWSTAWEFGRGRQLPKKELIPYRAIMTGTPVTKKKRVFDLYAQWKFLNPYRFQDLGTMDLFKMYYGVWTERNGYPQWLKNQNQDDLYRRISKDSFQIKRAECFDLPHARHQVIPITLEDNTRRVYDEMEAEMLSQLRNGEITTASIKLVQSLRLAQLTSGLAKTDTGKLYILGKEKINATRDILTDLFAAEEKVVIAARFRGDLQRLAALGRELRVPTYAVRGKQARSRRDRGIRDFRGEPSSALMLVQPQAASLGIDLSSASVMIWYSLTNSYVDFTQTCDRIALSRRETTFMHLQARDSVDEDLYAMLREDREVAESFLARQERLRT